MGERLLETEMERAGDTEGESGRREREKEGGEKFLQNSIIIELAGDGSPT